MLTSISIARPNSETSHDTQLPTQSMVVSAGPLKFHEVSVQKCGTHLLRKILTLFAICIPTENLHHFCSPATYMNSSCYV